MAKIVDYPVVVETLVQAGLECLYHNSGAFGFPRNAETHSVGWIGAFDSTIRPAALPFIRSVSRPYEANLAQCARKIWQEQFRGPLWLMPKSHWHYELEFGNRQWLPSTLQQVGITAADLAHRNNGSAIEFDATEADVFAATLQEILRNLRGSDFMLAWPGRPVVCTVHHHQQLWWTSTDAELIKQIAAAAPPKKKRRDPTNATR